MLQATLDKFMTDEGTARYNRGIENARSRQEESTTQYGQRLLSHAIVPFSDSIRAWLKEHGEVRAGRRTAAEAPLRALTPEVLAFLTTRSVLDSISLRSSFATASGQIGGMVEDETRFNWLRKNHAPLFRKLERQLERSMSYHHKRTVIVHTMNKAGIAARPGEKTKDVAVFSPWDAALRLKVGSVLIDLLAKSTGLVETTTIRSGRKTQIELRATAKTMEWIQNFNAYAEVLEPLWVPMVEPPAAWTGAWGGGYTGEELPVLPLVKRVPESYLKSLDTANMPEVYAAVNALQNTPWKINQRVFGVLRHFWDLGRTVGGLPQSEDDQLPTKPLDIDTNTDARKAWKQRAARIHASNAALRSTRLQARKLMNLAQKLSAAPKFYYPYQMDFRGRIYTVATFLTPQGSDLARSLLLFADGATINDDTDAYWLAVYGANLFGKDKITFEERVKWVKENRAAILATAADPLANQWWMDADEPWQFLAWCMEWSGWQTTGPGFQTHLPVCLDGTNNGLQLLSMLVRDEVAAKATNVTPSDSPADIYGDVARRVIDLMKEESVTECKAHADYWLAFGVDRKTTKRPVMVLPYGGTFHSCRGYVSEWYQDTAKARGVELPEFRVVAARCHYLAKKIWEGIEFCVGRPREAMTWLQECASLFSKQNLPISWVSPSGFPVLQAYKDWKVRRVHTTLGSHVMISMREEHPTKLSPSRQKNGISPNVVHSCDAAALVRTIALCQQQGIQHYAMIHDSYGTHAPRVHDMAATLRRAFVSLFSPDFLEALRVQLQAQLDAVGAKDKKGNPVIVPSVPAYGSLDVTQLYESEFFFA